MKKRIAAMLLAVSLLLTVPALAALVQKALAGADAPLPQMPNGTQRIYDEVSARYFTITWWPCMSMDCLWARPTGPSVFRTP